MNDESTAAESIPVESAVVTPAVPAPAPEEKEALAALRALGLRWADLGLGSSKALLQRCARLLDDAAVKIGSLQERVQSAQPAT